MAGWSLTVCLHIVTSLLYLFFCLLLKASASPVFENAPYVTTLYELESTARSLVSSFSCTDANQTSAPVVSLAQGGINPPSPCGTCFTVLPCQTGDYCLIFYPLEDISQQKAPNYLIPVECKSGNETVTTVVDVRIRRNTPPRFQNNQFAASASLSSTASKKAGTNVFDVIAEDDDNDTIVYSMTSEPWSDNFIIDGGGSIRAKNDLVVECHNFITFKVNVSDGHNKPVGPLSVQVALNGANEAPEITNIDLSLQVPEDTAVGSTIRQLTAHDDGPLNKVTYTLAANPPANLALFEIVGDQVKIKSSLDYENALARTTNLTIVAHDGACASPAHYIYVTVTDENEPPYIQPKNAAYSVYEGSNFGNPPLTIKWNVADEDQVDSRTYSIIGGNNLNLFSIDPFTGQLTVNGDYDIDNGAMPLNQTLLIRVTDKRGLTDNTTVVLNFKDRNDNLPEITAGNFDFSVCEANRKVGAVLGQMTCTDRDSSFQGNNQTYFTGGSGSITVLADGTIIMAQRPALGQTFTASAVCSDRGVYPGRLQSLAPVPISVTSTECPTTIAPIVQTRPPTTTTTPAKTTAVPATTAAPSRRKVHSWIDENLPWIVIAGLMATALLALLYFLISRYCRGRCAECCSRQWCQRRTPKPRRLKTPPRNVVASAPKPPTPPPTPLPAIVGTENGYLHDFWKERYPDDDYEGQPNRNANPRPVSPDDVISPNTGKGPGASVALKKRTCTVM